VIWKPPRLIPVRRFRRLPDAPADGRLAADCREAARSSWPVPCWKSTPLSARKWDMRKCDMLVWRMLSHVCPATLTNDSPPGIIALSPPPDSQPENDSRPALARPFYGAGRGPIPTVSGATTTHPRPSRPPPSPPRRTAATSPIRANSPA